MKEEKQNPTNKQDAYQDIDSETRYQEKMNTSESSDAQLDLKMSYLENPLLINGFSLPGCEGDTILNPRLSHLCLKNSIYHAKDSTGIGFYSSGYLEYFHTIGDLYIFDNKDLIQTV
ncbi:unnamed protein product [Clavelina lepadiformis]|uniref:Uncharacterized protein n=1 Tax=Clavelina lepadiformis TaxID=159417 RepID=A0ABP0F8H7_CLALP